MEQENYPQETYVTYDVAKLLHEKGFAMNPRNDYWKIDGNNIMFFVCSIGAYTSNKEDRSAFYIPEDSYQCPTQQMACRWLREKHGYFIHVSAGFPFEKGEQTLKYFWWPIKICEKHLEYPFEEEVMASSYEVAINTALEYTLRNLI